MGKSKFSYKFGDIKKLNDKFLKLKVDILSTQVESVQKATLLVHESAVKSLQSNADGTPQIRYHPKRVVNVSRPGTPPNTDTGRAVQSIKFDFKEKGLIGRIGTNLKYLAGLEFGTKSTEARPWLSTALENTKNEIKKIFKDDFKKSISKIAGKK